MFSALAAAIFANQPAIILLICRGRVRVRLLFLAAGRRRSRAHNIFYWRTTEHCAHTMTLGCYFRKHRVVSGSDVLQNEEPGARRHLRVLERRVR